MKTNSDSKWWLSESVVRKAANILNMRTKRQQEVVSAALSVRE